MIYLFHGEDEFTIAQTVSALRDRLAEEDPVADLNTSLLEGRGLTLAELQEAADAAPFLGERRLVIVRGLVGRCNPRGGDRGPEARKALAKSLNAYLRRVPDTTRLVLHEGKLDKRNPVLRGLHAWHDELQQPDQTLLLRTFTPPPPARFPAWLQQRADVHGGRIEHAAAAALADALGRDGAIDLRLADSELRKLLIYAGDRPVTTDDVEKLVTPVGIESIFRLVDALAERNGPRATSLLHRFLQDGEHPLRLLALVARQFRLLALTRAHLDEGTPPGELARHLPVPPFVARKLSSQARRFSMRFLIAALERLLEIDVGIKTGRVEAQLGLDLFVAGVCGTSAGSTGTSHAQRRIPA